MTRIPRRKPIDKATIEKRKAFKIRLTLDEIRKEVVASVEDGDTKTAIELPGEARYRMELAVDPQLMGRWVLRDMPDRKE